MNAAESVMNLEGAHPGERIHRLVEHDLPPAEEAVVREHLAACGTCATEHARLEQAVGALRSLGRATAPQGFSARVLRRIRFTQRRSHPLGAGAEHKVPFEGGIVILLAAAAAAAVLAWQVAGGERLVAGTPDEPAVEAAPN